MSLDIFERFISPVVFSYVKKDSDTELLVRRIWDDLRRMCLQNYFIENKHAIKYEENIDQMQIVLNLLKKFDVLYPKHLYHTVDIHSDGSCGIKYFIPDTRKTDSYLDWDMQNLQELYAFAKRMVNLPDAEILEEIQHQVNERLK